MYRSSHLKVKTGGGYKSWADIWHEVWNRSRHWINHHRSCHLCVSGMNAAVRATVRVGLYTGAKVYFVHEVRAAYRLRYTDMILQINTTQGLLSLWEIFLHYESSSSGRLNQYIRHNCIFRHPLCVNVCCRATRVWWTEEITFAPPHGRVCPWCSSWWVTCRRVMMCSSV